MGMRILVRRDLVWLTLVTAVMTQASPAYAKDSGDGSPENSTLVEELQRELSPSEFVLRSYPDQSLISVKLLGGVGKPGVYHLPQGTTLTTAIALAGGFSQRSEYDSVMISNVSQGGFKKLDIQSLMTIEGRQKDPILQTNDMVLVKEQRNNISPDTVSGIVIIATVVATILSAITIRQVLRSDQ